MNFSCNGCGGCCHGPIALTLREAISLTIGNVPLVVTYVVTDVRNVPVEKAKDGYSTAMKKFSREISGFYDKTLTNRKIVVHPQIISLVPFDAPCPNLVDNLCAIYENRPSVCSLYPFRVDTPISYSGIGLERERNLSFERSAHIPCEGWDRGDLIFRSGLPVDSLVISDLKNRNSDMATTRDILKQFYNHLKLDDDCVAKIDEYSAVNVNDGRVVQSSFYSLCKFMQKEKLLAESDLVLIANHQKESLLQGVSSIRGSGANETTDRDTFIKIYENYLGEFSPKEAA